MPKPLSKGSASATSFRINVACCRLTGGRQQLGIAALRPCQLRIRCDNMLGTPSLVASPDTNVSRVSAARICCKILTAHPGNPPQAYVPPLRNKRYVANLSLDEGPHCVVIQRPFSCLFRCADGTKPDDVSAVGACGEVSRREVPPEVDTMFEETAGATSSKVVMP